MPEDVGFYLLMLQKREAADSAVQQCYSQLCDKLGYYGSLEVTIDGAPEQLAAEHMAATRDPGITVDRDSFLVFRGVYIKAFEDGNLMVKLVRDVAELMGESLDEFEDKLKETGKTNHQLRAVYWFIDQAFISKMPPFQQVSFTVDCMMFGAWRCNSPNVIGMHLVALACMLGLKQFHIFLPPDLLRHPCVASPPFNGFLEKKSIALTLNVKDVKVAAPGAGAGVAKTAEKHPKEDKKLAKDDKKLAKDDKKLAKDDKKLAKDNKKLAKDDNKFAKKK